MQLLIRKDNDMIIYAGKFKLTNHNLNLSGINIFGKTVNIIANQHNLINYEGELPKDFMKKSHSFIDNKFVLNIDKSKLNTF
jgi:hypothetical protein